MKTRRLIVPSHPDALDALRSIYRQVLERLPLPA